MMLFSQVSGKVKSPDTLASGLRRTDFRQVVFCADGSEFFQCLVHPRFSFRFRFDLTIALNEIWE
jgi:hypothetical protein